MKKIWKEAEIIETNICETACYFPCYPQRPQRPQIPPCETSGQNTKPEGNKKPGCGFPFWPWF